MIFRGAIKSSERSEICSLRYISIQRGFPQDTLVFEYSCRSSGEEVYTALYGAVRPAITATTKYRVKIKNETVALAQCSPLTFALFYDDAVHICHSHNAPAETPLYRFWEADGKAWSLQSTNVMNGL